MAGLATTTLPLALPPALHGSVQAQALAMATPPLGVLPREPMREAA